MNVLASVSTVRQQGGVIGGLVLALAFGWGVWAQETASPQPTPDPVLEAAKKAQEKLASWQTQEAKEILKPVEAQAKTRPPVAQALAMALFQEKKYGDAVKVLQDAVKAAPEEAALYVSLGELYRATNNGSEATAAYRKAKELAEKVLVRDDKDRQARLSLALAQLNLKEVDKAAGNLEKLLEGQEKPDPLILYHLGVARLYQGKAQDAFDTLSKVLEANSGMAYAYYYRGLAADKLGKKDVLINDMGRFLYLAPNAPEASKAQAIVSSAKR
ncbi:MAG: tetratricopeptide repeat protein [Thermoanaerobaculum sp.]